MPEELRRRLDDAASASGRSLNKEIVNRLAGSFEAQSPTGAHPAKGEQHMGKFTSRRTLGVLVAIAVALAATIGGLLATSGDSTGSTKTRITFKQLQYESQGAETGAGGESNDYLIPQSQFAQARTPPSGIVDPRASSP